jgi:hypothetical protein
MGGGVERYEAERIRAKWLKEGEAVYAHPIYDEEYNQGLLIGRYVCMMCGAYVEKKR